MRFNAVMPEEIACTEFQPLAPLLAATPAETLAAIRLRLASLGREELIKRFRVAFAGAKRLTSLVFADALIAEGIPPAFWHENQQWAAHSLNPRFDLFLFDVRWLRRWYPEHVRVVRYKRCRQLLSTAESAHHREAEYAFYAGRRPPWKLVASLGLSKRQQWDCAFLRSAPIAKHHAITLAASDKVFKVLQEDMQSVRRTSAFTDDDAQMSLLRRHALWICSRMADGPTETAIRFQQLTGEEITRQAVAKQLAKVDEVLRKASLILRLKSAIETG